MKGLPADAPVSNESRLFGRVEIPGLPAPGQTGRTIHNVPEELPPPEAEQFARAETVKRRIRQWGREAVADQQAAVGSFPPYFIEFRDQLRRSVEHAPNPMGKKAAENVASSLQSAAQQFGSTGSAYKEESKDRTAEPFALASSGAQRAAAEIEARNRFNEGLAMREFADGKLGAGIVAILQLEHAFNGQLRSSLLLRSSGNKSFDNYVLSLAPKVAARVPVPDGGTLKDGTRSEWEFAGRVSYKRDMREIKIEDDWWYLLLTSPLVIGDIDPMMAPTYVDFRNPSFSCRVRLLRVLDGDV